MIVGDANINGAISFIYFIVILLIVAASTFTLIIMIILLLKEVRKQLIDMFKIIQCSLIIFFMLYLIYNYALIFWFRLINPFAKTIISFNNNALSALGKC